MVGFIIGTRGRQIVAALKVTGQAVRSFTIKIPQAASVLGQSTAGDDDDGGEKDEAEEDDKELEIADFFNPADGDVSLADHPDIHLSPVMLYQIKKSKEELRIAQRRAALLAEGFDETEVDERMQMEAMAGGGGGGARANPLALLISVGARVEATAGGSSAEAAQLQERRRLQRNVDQFLLRATGVEKYKPEKEQHGRVKSASEVARETALHPVGGLSRKIAETNIPRAKQARNLLRVWHEANEKQMAREQPKKGMQRERAGAGDVGGGGLLDAASLAELQAEFADDNEEDEEGDVEEGEDYDDAEQAEEDLEA